MVDDEQKSSGIYQCLFWLGLDIAGSIRDLTQWDPLMLEVLINPSNVPGWATR